MLKNQIIVVTGGAGLLGQSFVKGIALQNGVAVIADCDETRRKQVCVQIKQELQLENIDHCSLDITNKLSIHKMFDKLTDKYGKIDALVNNAYPRNKNYGRDFFDVEYEDLCENLNLHLGGYFLVSQQIGTYFIKQGWGNIINISSIYGVIPPKFEIYEGTTMTMPVEYALIKSALIHLTQYMSKFFKGRSIRVNSISPGGVIDQQPVPFLEKYKDLCLNKGMLDPTDLIGTLNFLLSDMSKYINGQNLIVDDGFCL
jgi:NAD(P)-dependent dehydrogenase (short-subunit alcohol dehydrogenase family)